MNGQLLVRDPELYPEQLKYILDMITINETPIVVGSTAYLVHKYPSDVDVFERVTVNYSREEAALFYWDQFKNIIEKLIVNSDDVFILDFKVGEDPRYAEIGTEDEIIERLSQNKLLTSDILEAKGTPIFSEILRQNRILRWRPEEVLRGEKQLLQGRISFVEAVSQPAIVKLDTVTWISGRFQAVEVFYNLGFADGEFFPLGSYTDSLLKDVEKYASREYYSPLRLAKRLWALSRVTECTDVVQAINPLLGSDTAALNQIRADIESLQGIIHGYLPVYQITRIFSEVLVFHKRITNHLRGDPYLIIHQELDAVFLLWREWQKTSRFDKERLLAILEVINDQLMTEVKLQSESFIRQLDTMNVTCKNPRFQIPIF